MGILVRSMGSAPCALPMHVRSHLLQLQSMPTDVVWPLQSLHMVYTQPPAGNRVAGPGEQSQSLSGCWSIRMVNFFFLCTSMHLPSSGFAVSGADCTTVSQSPRYLPSMSTGILMHQQG